MPATVAPGSELRLKRRSVILMVVLTIFSLGFYYPAWFLRRRSGLNALNSPQKLAKWPFLLFLAVLALDFAVEFASAPARPEQVIGRGLTLLLGLVQIAVGLLMIVQCFRIKDILEDHLMPPDAATAPMLANQATLSGLLTFFFTIFYLQYVINRDIISRQPAAV